MQEPAATASPPTRPLDDDEISLAQLLAPLARQRWALLLVPLLVGAAAVGASFLVPPTFTARAMLLPPQGQSSGASAALASLGGLASLAGAPAVRTPADQLASLLQSTTVETRLVERFQLREAYERKLMVDARERLRSATRVSAGRKDGLITIEVDDSSPQRAADLTNGYIDELRRLSATLAVTEAQQRRVFFEAQLKETRDRLAQAQAQLAGAGVGVGTLKAEPRAAADGYARLRAELTNGEVRLQTLRGTLNDNAPEVQQTMARLAALRSQLAQLESSDASGGGNSDYIGRYREFKYQEALFELYSRQYELARIDESREGAFIQVVDAATPPEKKSGPKRSQWGLLGAATALILLAGFLVGRELRRTLRR